MSILVSSKTISPTNITCDELTKITLSLEASPAINDNPVDIMLVLDRSGSMDGAPLAALKLAAKEFIDIIKSATNPGDPTATDIGAPSRIGIVSFSDSAHLDQSLTRDISALDDKIDLLAADGRTNHTSAFEIATANFIPVLMPANKKILIMFTDGDTTTGGDANPAALAARDAGIEIYCIGLGNIDASNLEDWASLPTADHVILAPTPEELAAAFKKLAESISPPGAIDITVVDTLEDEFEIVGTPAPIMTDPPTTSAGFTVDSTGKIITWTLDRLGYSDTETATISFYVRYLGSVSATLPVNKTITYTDKSDPENTAEFDGKDTRITIDCEPSCNNVFTPDCCESSVDVPFKPCDTMIVKNLPNDADFYTLKCDGRILSLQVRLKNVCPGRRIAVGVIVTEIIGGQEVSSGFKAVTVPSLILPPTCPCGTVVVKPMVFILPEPTSDTLGLCKQRVFRVRVVSHYMDTGIENFNICNISPAPPVPVFN